LLDAFGEQLSGQFNPWIIFRVGRGLLGPERLAEEYDERQGGDKVLWHIEFTMINGVMFQ
jgi:hypothetical protein